MKTRTLFGIFLMFLALGQLYGQNLSFGGAVDPINRSAHVRTNLDLNKHLRFGLEYTDYFRDFIGWVCTEAAWVRQWYADLNFSYVFPVKDHWAFYSRTGIGLNYGHWYSAKYSERFQESEEYYLGGLVGLGAEFRLERLRFFVDGTLVLPSNTAGNLMFGISYILFQSKK